VDKYLYRNVNIFLFIRAKLNGRHAILAMLLVFTPTPLLMATQNDLIIDDRSTNDFRATSGNAWYLVTDGVMGGISRGQLSLETVESRPCLRMQGDVSLENNGGFIQIALDLSDDILKYVPNYTGVLLEVYGNNEQYNIHLRTQDISLPWQSYRIIFSAAPEWKMLHLPFAEFTPYRIDKTLDISRLRRIGIVAIGRAFHADLCIGKIGLY
jgi:hypothetical protein